MNPQELTSVSDWVIERGQRTCSLKYDGDIDFLVIKRRTDNKSDPLITVASLRNCQRLGFVCADKAVI
ncbi:TPA: hypothetical protein ACU525_004412, partial [Yersinia enterocolitica]